MSRKSPFDQTRYEPCCCCGGKPKFQLAPDARIWLAKCTGCGYVACALDGSAERLADAWNDAMRKKEGGK
jgi:hypothetical protein